MANPWPHVKLGEVTVNHDGRRVPVREADRKPGPYPYYGASGVVDHVDGYVFEGLHLLIAEDGENLRTRQTPVAFLADGRFWVNNHAHILCGNERADTRFLCYALAVTDIGGYLTGSAMPKLTQRSLNAIEVPLPPIGIQRTIADTLGSIDDKIEQNRRTGRKLEELARAVFKAWFVDFEPVKAKAAGAKSFPGMPPATFAALPTRLIDSLLGPVPKGWEVLTLEDVAESMKGLSYKGAGLVPPEADDAMGSLPLHNLNSVYEGGGYKNEGIKRYCGEYKDRHLIRPGDLIVANTEQGHEYRLIGFPAIVPKRFGDHGLFSHHIFRVRPLPNSIVGVQFLYHAMMSSRIRDEIVGCTNGTTVNMLSIDGLKRPRICVPNRESAADFEQRASMIYELSQSLYDESVKLSTMRDYLLPRLLSGRVRVTKHTGH